MEKPTPRSTSEAELQKRETLEALCSGVPDALFLLSGVSEVIDSKTKEKKYKPGSYADVDWKGFMTGGKARALALVELAKHFPEAVVAVNSNTFNIHDPLAPTDAEVMAEFVKRKGVEMGRVLMQDQSTTTFTELIELLRYVAKYEWKHPVVVAGESQKLRAEEMFRQLDTLQDPDGAWRDPEFREALEKAKNLGTVVTFVSSEDVLPIRDPRYSELISAARNTDTWRNRENMDRKAFDDLAGGRYWKDIYKPTSQS